MERTIQNIISKETVKSSLFDVIALSVVYLVPVFSHLFSFPLYLLEPMRLMLILAVAHTSRKNAYIIAATMPLFSFIISAHPVFIKALIMSAELVFNVWLFFYISEKLKNNFASMLISIGLSKIIYYAVKFTVLSLVLMTGSLVATPVWIQLVTMLVFSSYFLIKKDIT